MGNPFEIEDLITEVEDAKTALDEANESGDLEERLELAIALEDAETRLCKARMLETGGL